MPIAGASQDKTVLALCGGIGGAKLALGLYHELPRHALCVVVNTGDDFEHLDLHVSPDVDTVLYTLADLADPERGWGRRDETWSFMRALEELGGDTWFRLGDADLAAHLERTRRLRAGEPLSRITQDFARRWRIEASVLPMSDDPVRTEVVTEEGVLPFQHYFVRRGCEPRVRAIRFAGSATARSAPGLCGRIRDPALTAIVLCPSNPYLSVDPLLSIAELRQALADAAAPVVAVAPIIGGRAIKGPTAKLMGELGVEVSAAAVARHYAGLIDGYVIDQEDRDLRHALEIPARVAKTVMTTLEDRRRLAAVCLDFADELRAARGGRS